MPTGNTGMAPRGLKQLCLFVGAFALIGVSAFTRHCSNNSRPQRRKPVAVPRRTLSEKMAKLGLDRLRFSDMVGPNAADADIANSTIR